MRPRDELGPFSFGDIDFGDIEFGFVFGISPEVAENFRVLFADAPVDEEVDRRIAEWRCPGCGRGMGELAEGHAWSFDTKTRQYRCDDPPTPLVGAAPFTLDCGILDLTGTETNLVVEWDHE
jgi:hypothetical protein